MTMTNEWLHIFSSFIEEWKFGKDVYEMFTNNIENLNNVKNVLKEKNALTIVDALNKLKKKFN